MLLIFWLLSKILYRGYPFRHFLVTHGKGNAQFWIVVSDKLCDVCHTIFFGQVRRVSKRSTPTRAEARLRLSPPPASTGSGGFQKEESKRPIDMMSKHGASGVTENAVPGSFPEMHSDICRSAHAHPDEIGMNVSSACQDLLNRLALCCDKFRGAPWADIALQGSLHPFA